MGFSSISLELVAKELGEKVVERAYLALMGSEKFFPRSLLLDIVPINPPDNCFQLLTHCGKPQSPHLKSEIHLQIWE